MLVEFVKMLLESIATCCTSASQLVQNCLRFSTALKDAVMKVETSSTTASSVCAL